MNQGLIAVFAVIGALAAVFLAVFAALVAYDAVSGSGMMDDMGEMMEDVGGMMDGMMGDRGPETTGSASGRGEVRIVDFSFQPTTFTIIPGTVVIWTNEDSAPHTATGDEFDTGRLDEGETSEVTFDEQGNYDYVCDYHRWMEGRVVVTPEPTQTTGP